jgi:scyllo-inositol 2-dehydrogenase (NADP+)
LADEEIELVVVNTPNYTHYELAKAALNAGKHVLIEKPLSVLRVEAEELFSLAFRKGLKVFAYQNRRFDSDFLSVKEVLESGRIGKIVEAHFRFDRYRDEISVKFFKEEPMPGAGILYDLGAHIIDQAISLFGVPDEFLKSYGNNRALSQVDDYAHVHLKYKNGVNVFVTANMLVADAPAAYSLYGTKGTYTKQRTDVQEEQLLMGMKPLDENYGMENSGVEGKLVYYNDNGDKGEEFISIRKGDYMELFDGVYNSIRNNEEYYVQQNEIMAQLRILEK